ncbi:MAG: hypothetical protein KDK56_10160 [Simkania sp.]|nr:hypothetical protein [Simkania sp.]
MVSKIFTSRSSIAVAEELFRKAFFRNCVHLHEPLGISRLPYSSMAQKGSFLFSDFLRNGDQLVLGKQFSAEKLPLPITAFSLGNSENLIEIHQHVPQKVPFALWVCKDFGSGLLNDYKPSPLLDPVKIQRWRDTIQAEKGIVFLDDMKAIDFSNPENVDLFIAALHSIPDEIYSISLPDRPTAYFLEQLFQFASFKGMHSLSRLYIVRPGEGESSYTYDLFWQELDLKDVEKLLVFIGSSDILKFDNIPLTPKYTQFFIDFSLKFTESNHLLVFDFKPSNEIAERGFEKEELK